MKDPEKVKIYQKEMERIGIEFTKKEFD